MRSGHGSRGRAWLAWIICLAGFWAASAHAQSTVVCTGIDDPALFARIVGQTQDLPITLKQAQQPAWTRPSAQQLRALATASAAQFVVAIEAQPNGARSVYVFDARAGDLRVRSAPAPDRRNRFARSAAAETVAVIVRGELSDALAAQAAQRRVGQTSATAPPTGDQPDRGDTAPGTGLPARGTTDPAPAQSTAATESPSPVSPDERTSHRPLSRDERTSHAPATTTQAEPAEANLADRSAAAAEPAQTQQAGEPWFEPVRVSLELTGRVASPSSGRWFVGPTLALRLFLRNVSVGVVAATSLPSRRQSQGLDLSLYERSVGLEMLGHIPLTRGLVAGFGAAGRWLSYAREAASADPDWLPQREHTASSFAAGGLLELRWQFLQHLGLSVRFGLDVVFQPLSLRYRAANASSPTDLESLRRFEPWTALGAFGTL